MTNWNEEEGEELGDYSPGMTALVVALLAAFWTWVLYEMFIAGGE